MVECKVKGLLKVLKIVNIFSELVCFRFSKCVTRSFLSTYVCKRLCRIHILIFVLLKKCRGMQFRTRQLSLFI